MRLLTAWAQQHSQSLTPIVKQLLGIPRPAVA
jgi:hypothetical protein